LNFCKLIFSNVCLLPNPISTVAVCVDSETLEWFRSKGEESEQHMAAALKIYAAAQKMAAGMSKST
jgi:uncharacterized protein (DUF4415 family)